MRDLWYNVGMKTEAIPRVGAVDALSTGLVEAARRPWLMIIPLVTELLLWLAPPISIAQLLSRVMGGWEALMRTAAYQPGQLDSMNKMIASMQEMAAHIGAQFNLAEMLSGGWMGAPGIIPLAQITRLTFITDLVLIPTGLTPALPRLMAAPWRGAPIEVTSAGTLLLLTVSLWLVGQVLAAVYLRWAAQSWRYGRTVGVAPAKPADHAPAPLMAPPLPWAGMGGLARLSLRLILFSLLVGVVVMILQAPLALAAGLIWLSNGSALGMLMSLFGGVALWLTLWFLISLYFVNEAIVLDQQPIWRGVARSLMLVQRNFWPTLALGFLVNLLMYGFRAVWGLVGQHPAGAVVAIVINAYLATSMLLAIFAFYDNMAHRVVTERVVSRQ
jgi:hypothetical protein